jgi:hypothetical protein
MVRHERASLTDGVLHRSDGGLITTGPPEWVRPLVVTVLAEAEQPVRVEEVRTTVHEHPVMAELWERVAADGMIRSAYARGREQTWISSWVIASALGSSAVVINGVAAFQEHIPEAVWAVFSALFVITTVASPFVLLSLYDRRQRRISGYGSDPRTRAGLCLAELAAVEEWSSSGGYPDALTGEGRWELEVIPDDLGVNGGHDAVRGQVDEVKSVADDLGFRGGGM